MTASKGNPGKRPLGRSGLEIAPLVFGGNVFGWTVDEKRSFELLDRFFDAGFNAVDTADVYSAWVPGNQGGESETIIGNWFKASPSRRSQAVLITKVGWPDAPGGGGLKAEYILKAVDDSLRRLQTDYIDLYFSHHPDAQTPIEETLRAHEKLLQQGKVRAIGASNYDAAQLREALTVSERENLPRYDVLQPEYNLYDRAGFEGALRALARDEGLGVITYFSLASGFLSGKYRSLDDLGQSARGSRVEKYLNPRGLRILDALDKVAGRHNARPAEVALAWLIGSDGVTAPIASATRLDQLESLLKATTLRLSAEDYAVLDQASAASS
ncbi:aldo/keto reductase [Kerstersia gyiorum]|uniref:Alcohol dehydrogenase n=1 Tax=Kerstersia gyiorum TaxID=206506 RepID=A0A171KV95_9BURK|nr:aldo/keto reductase [Kerstersia gyiorum]KKO72812.1 alcohol dehydrogenase [Kerstersia gyiorum]